MVKEKVVIYKVKINDLCKLEVKEMYYDYSVLNQRVILLTVKQDNSFFFLQSLIKIPFI